MQCSNIIIFSEIEPSIINSDICMPEMDGLTATRLIRMFNSNLPVIATTAHALSRDEEKCLNAGYDDYQAKPINSNQMILMMDKYMN